MLSIGVFSSFRDREAVALLAAAMEATRSGRINAKIHWVFCNDFPINTTESLMGIVGADSTPLLWIKSRNFRAELWHNDRDEWRKLYDRVVLDFLQHSQKPDVIMLAGYMLIVSPILCEYFHMLNLHPSLPEVHEGTWRQVTQKVVDGKDRETGSSMLWVTEGVDVGPAASFCRINVEGCNFAEVRRRQFGQEIPLMLATLDALAKGIIGIGSQPVDFTSVVEESLMAHVA